MASGKYFWFDVQSRAEQIAAPCRHRLAQSDGMESQIQEAARKVSIIFQKNTSSPGKEWSVEHACGQGKMTAPFVNRRHDTALLFHSRARFPSSNAEVAKNGRKFDFDKNV